MTKSARRYRLVILLVVTGIASQHVTALAQEIDRRSAIGAESASDTVRPANSNRQPIARAALAQFEGRGRGIGGADGATTDRPRDMIAVTVWVLTVKHAAAPEDEKLVGKLLEKACALPTVVGTVEEVRELVGRLKAADLLEQSREIRLTSLDGQTGVLQSGANEPRIIATNVDPVAGQSNSLNIQAVGTVLSVLPRISSASDVELSVEYNTSHVEKSNEIAIYKPVKGEPMLADVVVTNQITSSVRLTSGTAIVLSSDTSFEAADDAHARTRLAIVAASVIPALDEPRDANDTRANPSAPELELNVPEPEIAIETDN